MFTLERQVELQAFWYSGRPLRILAEQWQCTVGYISAKAKQVGLPSRQTHSYQRRLRRTINFAATLEARKYFDGEAERRGLYPRELEALLVQVISEDRLVLAVLDDSEQLRQHERAA